MGLHSDMIAPAKANPATRKCENLQFCRRVITVVDLEVVSILTSSFPKNMTDDKMSMTYYKKKLISHSTLITPPW